MTWTVSGANQRVPTAVRSYNKPTPQAPIPVSAGSNAHVLDTPVQPESLGGTLPGPSLAFFLTAAPDRRLTAARDRRPPHEVTVTATIRGTPRGREDRKVARVLTVQAPEVLVDKSKTSTCSLGINLRREPPLVERYVLGDTRAAWARASAG